MRPEVGRRLLEISARFYEHHGPSFDATRSRPWPGWSRLWQSLRDDLPVPGPLRCFDAGCGNGRFGLFLLERLTDRGPSGPQLRYVGVDRDPGLLDAARRDLDSVHGGSDFVLAPCDLAQDDSSDILPADAQDLVTLLGVLHHIPDETMRRRLLRRLARRVAPGGRLAVSIWRLDQDTDRFERKRVPWPEWNEFHDADMQIDPTDLEQGDQLLSWRGDRQVPRYCHFPTDDEIERLTDLGPHLEVVDRFEADGPTGRDNLYVTWLRREAC